MPPFTLNCFHSLCTLVVTQLFTGSDPWSWWHSTDQARGGLSSTHPFPQCIVVLKLPRSQSVTPLSLWLCTSHWFSSPYIHPFPQHFRLQIFVSAREWVARFRHIIDTVLLTAIFLFNFFLHQQESWNLQSCQTGGLSTLMLWLWRDFCLKRAEKPKARVSWRPCWTRCARRWKPSPALSGKQASRTCEYVIAYTVDWDSKKFGMQKH